MGRFAASGHPSSKSGICPSKCVELAKHVKLACPNLILSGLLTIGMKDYSSTPENFKALANCKLEFCKALGIPTEQFELSMGMSGDFEQAALCCLGSITYFCRFAAAVPNLDMVEGVGNEKIANHLDHAVVSLGREPLEVMVQINTSGEESKSGVDPSKCVELAKHVKLACPNLILSGLMTIGMKDYSSTPENFKVAFYYDIIMNNLSVLTLSQADVFFDLNTGTGKL
ncbi:unnamed protein product [Triticum turgidum subsp. durum]|uniref:Alanine racemase N-terminal domain-containing protein n=1 Tax=Triticum turgidum subsp. durum TaxID=4567 RepID=A0A9R1S8C4_TRITD|nr:unnamed protein product [Triticum turgidum subsp. durum]